MNTFFDKQAMDELLRTKHLTKTAWARNLGISRVTLFRKETGVSDFYLNEITKTCEFVNENSLNSIFFAKKVT